MSSWGCQSGSWFAATCVTTPGSGFTLPITLNIYSVGAANAVGSLLATKTQSFFIPYRPSSNPVHCTGGRWWNGTTCFNGYATPITFGFTGVAVPANVIVSVAYNTSHYGYAPKGQSTACYTSSGGCGYDSLNIGLISTAPTTGSDPTPNAAYQLSPYGSQYCDNGAGGTGTFRLDDGCWAPYQPAFKITAGRPICHVPNLIGMDIPTAKAAITAAHCSVGVVTKIDLAHGGTPGYLVVSQMQTAGATLTYPGWVSFTAGKAAS